MTILGTALVTWFGSTFNRDVTERQLSHQTATEERARERDAYRGYLDAAFRYETGVLKLVEAAKAGDGESQADAQESMDEAQAAVQSAVIGVAMHGTTTVMALIHKADVALRGMVDNVSSSRSLAEAERRLTVDREEVCKALTDIVVEIRKRLDTPMQGADACLPMW